MAKERYVSDIRGFEQALFEAHQPFDIISTASLDDAVLQRYRILVLPSLAWLNNRTVTVLRSFVVRGGSLVASYETGSFDGDGNRRRDFALADLFGITCEGENGMAWDDTTSGIQQAYLRVTHTHDILKHCTNTGLLPFAGPFCRISPHDGTIVPLVRTRPFRVFPEGLSYPEGDDPAEPMTVLRETGSGGRTAYFPFQPGSLFYNTRIPDIGALMANTVAWALGGTPVLTIDAPSTLHVSLRRGKGRWMVHCVNLTGGERFFTGLVPLHDCMIGLRKPQDGRICSVRQASDGMALEFVDDGSTCAVRVPQIDDYDIIVFKTE